MPYTAAAAEAQQAAIAAAANMPRPISPPDQADGAPSSSQLLAPTPPVGGHAHSRPLAVAHGEERISPGGLGATGNKPDSDGRPSPSGYAALAAAQAAQTAGKARRMSEQQPEDDEKDEKDGGGEDGGEGLSAAGRSRIMSWLMSIPDASELEPPTGPARVNTSIKVNLSLGPVVQKDNAAVLQEKTQLAAGGAGEKEKLILRAPPPPPDQDKDKDKAQDRDKDHEKEDPERPAVLQRVPSAKNVLLQRSGSLTHDPPKLSIGAASSPSARTSQAQYSISSPGGCSLLAWLFVVPDVMDHSLPGWWKHGVCYWGLLDSDLLSRRSDHWHVATESHAEAA